MKTYKEMLKEAKEKLPKDIVKKRRLEKKNNSETYEYDNEKYQFYKGIISLIDEPILRIKLSEMLSEIDENDDFHDDLIKEQIDYLKDKLKNNAKGKTIIID